MDPRLPDILYDMMIGMRQGKGAPHGFNFADVVLVPSGEELSDAMDVTRHASKLRPLSLKNCDAKAVAAAANRALAPLAAARAHASQQGFVRGRNFLSHVVRQDAFAHAANHHPTLSPLFLFFDLRSAFPIPAPILPLASARAPSHPEGLS